MTSSILEPVRPVAPAAGYIGGKRNLAARLVAMIDRVDHDGYAEPFVGIASGDAKRAAELVIGTAL
jgi:DNA adenine methylase